MGETSPDDATRNPSRHPAMNNITTTTPKPSALAVMASKVNIDPAKLHATLKATVFKGASDEEMLALVVVANTYGLNPLLKELYAFPAKGGGIVPVVSIDGWVSMVNTHPQMDGMEFEEHRNEAGALQSITCRIWRKDRNRPIAVTEHLSECKRNSEPWRWNIGCYATRRLRNAQDMRLDSLALPMRTKRRQRQDCAT